MATLVTKDQLVSSLIKRTAEVPISLDTCIECFSVADELRRRRAVLKSILRNVITNSFTIYR